MATNRKRIPRSRQGSIETLSESQRHVLLTGRDYFGDAFRDEEERREAWEKHRQGLLAYWEQDPAEWSKTNKHGHGNPLPGGPGSRPWGWWQHEAPEPKKEAAKSSA